jgi:hypothetical protein
MAIFGNRGTDDPFILFLMDAKIKSRDAYTADFMAYKFEFKGDIGYYVIKSRFSSQGLQHGDYVERELKRLDESSREHGGRKLNIHIVESDTIELRLKGILNKDFFIQ